MLIASLLALSHLSNFDATQVKSLNWDIVVMLTPLGLINNFVLHPDSYLRPYYQVHVSAFDPVSLLLAIVVSLLAFTLLINLRGRQP